MENKLYFNAREWSFNPECTTNKGERSFISGINGELTEAFTISSWEANRDWTEIISPTLTLEKNMKYSFTFWLNGGENDRFGDEVCQLHVVFNNDKKNALIYKLNRNFIKPYKKYKGWNLYEIPFVTGENEYTQLKFVACNAFTTIMEAKEKEAYTELNDVLDEFEELRPQRHNIVWADGWPTNTWYSTKALKEKGMASHSFGSMNFPDFMTNRYNRMASQNNRNFHGDEINMNKLRDKILERINVNEIRENILKSINMEEIKKSMKENIMK